MLHVQQLSIQNLMFVHVSFNFIRLNENIKLIKLPSNIAGSRGCEGRARQLFGIQTIRTLLRVVLNRQSGLITKA